MLTNEDLKHYADADRARLRDMFAAAALTGLLANNFKIAAERSSIGKALLDASKLSFEAADAMLSALEGDDQ